MTFARDVLAFRRAHAVLRREAFYGEHDIQWFDPQGAHPNWLDQDQRQLACMVRGQEGPDLYLIFNAGADPVSFVLPASTPSGRWRLAIDTAKPSSETADVAGREWEFAAGSLYAAASRSSAILVA